MIMTEETGRKLTATTFFFSKQTIKKKKLKKGGKFCHWISLADLHMYRWHTGDGADLWPNGQPAAYSGRLSSYRSSCLSEQRTRNVVLSLHWKNLAATPERCFFFSNRLMHKSCQLSLLIGDLKLWGKPRDREGATACLYVEKSTYQNPKWHSLRRT